MFNLQDPGMVESLSKNVTRQGMTSTTLNYLRVRMQWSWTLSTLSCFSPMTALMFKPFLLFQLCVILEPMQELMSRHKAYALNPRDCLKTTLFQKWQKMVAPPGKESRKSTHLPIRQNSRYLACIWPTHMSPSDLNFWRIDRYYDMPDFFCNWIVCWVKGICNVSLNVWL